MNNIEKKIIENDSELSPSPRLKASIVSRAQNALTEDIKVREPKKHISFRFVLTPILAALVLLIGLATVLSLRFEHYETIYIDVNPSMSLTMNRFDRVVDYELINDDSKEIFANVNFKNMMLEDSMTCILDTLEKENKLSNDSYVCVSATSKNEEKTNTLLDKINSIIDKFKEDNEIDFDHEEDKVTPEEVIDSILSGIGPIKRRIINAILERDPEADINELKDFTMSQLKALLESLLK